MQKCIYLLFTTVLMVAIWAGIANAQDNDNWLAPPEVDGAAVYIPFPVEITLDGDLSDWDNIQPVTVTRGPYTTGNPAENEHVQQGITHQAVLTVDAAGHLAGDEETGDGGLTVRIYFQSAVLVVQCGVDKHRLFRNIDVVSLVDYIFAGKLLLYVSLAGQHVNHR